MSDDFHSPQPHQAPDQGVVGAVLARLAAMGNSVVSLLTGLLAAVLILYSGYVLYDSFYTQEQAFNSGWELLQYKPEIIEEGATPLAGQNKLQEILNDYRAWLTMYETNIDYPVVQGQDDLYYASHDIYGESSLTGAIYLAAGNTADFSDQYNLIYGHHMDNGAMFGALDRYLDEAYLLSHKEGVLITPIGVWDLEVFAVIETDAYEDKVYGVGPSRTVQDVMDFLCDPADNTNVHYLDEELGRSSVKITALSTCASAETNGRLVVFCRSELRNLLTVEMPDYEDIYDALTHHTVATVNYVEGTIIEYSIDGGVTWSETVPTILNVGTLNITVRATNEVYGRAIDTAVYIVHPRPVTVTARDESKVYGAPDPEFTAYVEGVIDDYRIAYSVSRPGAGIDEDVGTYPDAIIPTGETEQGNYIVSYIPADFTITAAQMYVVAIGYNGVYDAVTHYGSAQPSVTEGTILEYRVVERTDQPVGLAAQTNGHATRLSNLDSDDEGWTTEAPSILNIGSCTFEVRALNRNYTTAYDSAVLTVTPRPVTVTASPASKFVGDPDPGFTASVSGVIDGYRIAYSVSRPGAGRDEAVGVYPGAIIPTGEETQGNYIVSYVPADFTILDEIVAGELTLTPVHYYGYYDAQSHTGRAIPSVIAGTTVEYSEDGVNWTTALPTITDVGSRSVFARATNPTYGTAQTTVNLTVLPIPVVVTAADATKVYGTPDPEFTASVSGVIDDYEIVYTVSRPGAGIDEDVGVYPDAIIPTGEETQGNYIVTYVPAVFTITSDTMTLSAEGYSGIYDGETHWPSVEPSVEEDTVIEYSTDGGETWTTEMPSITDVGTVEVIVRATNPNYEPCEETIILEVFPRPAVVTAIGASKFYGEDDPEFSAVVDGVIDDFVIVYTVSRPGAGTDEEPGTYQNVIIPTGEVVQGNYIVTYIPANFSILTSGVTPTEEPGPDEPQPEKPEDEEITDPDVPFSRFFEIFKPAGYGGAAWALINLICLLCTVYLFFPILHLRDKFGRSKLMQGLNDNRRLLREELELDEQEAKEKLRINLLAAENRAKKTEGADEKSIAEQVSAAVNLGFTSVTADDFSEAVDELYYRIKKFLRRLRAGTVSEFILAVLALVWFIWTEDMRLPMILVDKWTPLMVFFLAVTWLIDVRLARYREKLLIEEEQNREELEAEKDAEKQESDNV